MDEKIRYVLVRKYALMQGLLTPFICRKSISQSLSQQTKTWMIPSSDELSVIGLWRDTHMAAYKAQLLQSSMSGYGQR